MGDCPDRSALVVGKTLFQDFPVLRGERELGFLRNGEP